MTYSQLSNYIKDKWCYWYDNDSLPQYGNIPLLWCDYTETRGSILWDFDVSQCDSRHHRKWKFHIDDTLSLVETTGAFKVSLKQLYDF